MREILIALPLTALLTLAIFGFFHVAEGNHECKEVIDERA